MDHVNSDLEMKTQAHISNSPPNSYQSQGTNEFSESMRLYLEESQSETQNNDHNDSGITSESTTVIGDRENKQNSPKASMELYKNTDNVDLQTKDATINSVEFTKSPEHKSFNNKMKVEAFNDVENNTGAKLDNVIDNGRIEKIDMPECTELFPTVSTDTLPSYPSESSVISTDISMNSLGKTTPTKNEDSFSHFNISQSEDDQDNLSMNEVLKLSNRKRKIESENLETIKLKRISDGIEVENQDLDSSKLEESLETSNSRTLINGETCLMLNSSENCLSSANVTGQKDELDLENFSGNDTLELRTSNLNNSEVMNIEGSSSPDQVPTFELVSRFDENNDIVSLIINRTDRKYLDYNADWSQNSSPGSVTSTGVFQLSDHKRISTMSSSTTSSAYSTKANDNFVIPAIPLKKTDIHKQGIKGHKELFRQIKDIFKMTCGDVSLEDFNMSNEKEDKSSENNLSTKQKSNEIIDSNYDPINSPELISNLAKKDSSDFSVTKEIKNETQAKTSLPLNIISEDSLEQDHRLMQRVLAKWVDKKYYAGRIIDIKDNNKFTIRFDDAHVKTLLSDYIIFGEQNVLPLQGQSIYVLLNDEDEYVPGIVLSTLEEVDEILYIVQTDNGTNGSVRASDIYLTEDQAKAIKECYTNASIVDNTRTPKKTNGQDVSLDNIIHGPRSRRQATIKTITPKAGSSGLNKLKRNARRGSKQRNFSESSDRSVTEPPSPASTTDFDETSSVKGVIEEVHGVEPEVQKTPKKIVGVLTGPFPVKGCGRLSGRRTSKVTGNLFDNSDPDTVNLLGPIPASNKIFHKKCFLLTCTEDVSEKLKLARLTSYDGSGTDSEYSTDIENCTVPFMKERLKYQIEAGGGVVYSHFEDVPQKKYRNCILIAPRACLTAKYIQCLASNIRAVLHTWVVDCCKSNKLVREYDLPAGWSLERKCYIGYEIGKERYMRLSNNPFNNFLIILCSDNDNFLKFWGRVCKSAGASTKVIENEEADISVGSVIVTDFDCPLKVRKQAQSLDIPLVSTTWVVQSLILGQVCNYDNIYAYNYMDTD